MVTTDVIETSVAAVGIAGLAATASLQETLNTAIQETANAYLDLTNANTIVGRIAAVASILTIDALQYTMNPLFYQQDAGWAKSVNQRGTDVSEGSLSKFMAMSSEWTRRAFAMFLQPSINGIVIVSSNESSNRDVDVSEEPLIVQTTKMSTTYVVDNAVPRPRTWQVQGYLLPLAPTVDQLIPSKPTIWFQKKMLDAFAKSRRPVLYKSSDLEFTQVLITRFSWDQEATVNNGLKVSLSLKEYATITCDSGLATLTATEVKT